MKILIYTIFGCMYSVLAVYADIQIASPTELLPGQPSKELESISTNMAGDFIGTIIAWVIGLTAVLTVLAITWAGIQMVLAIGDEEKMKKSRHTMIYAFIGLIVAGLAYAIVNLVTKLQLDTFL